MKRILVLPLFFALLPTASAATRSAHVELVSSSPVVVTGAGFRKLERVVVTVSASETRKKAVVSTRRGAIRAAFTGFKIAYCEPYMIRAKGNKGSRVLVKIIPDCPNQAPA